MNCSNCIHSNKRWLKAKYISEGLTLREISSICGCTHSAIYYAMKKLGIKRRAEGFNTGLRHRSINWKGGKTTSYGYTLILVGRYNCKDGRKRPRYELEHRLVASKILGRKLKRGEIIHHINHIRNDNRPENLYLFKNNAEHKRYENIKNQLPLKSNLSMNGWNISAQLSIFL